MVLTLSKDGVALLDREGNFAMLPAMIRFVHDAASAGDTVVSVLAAAMASGASLFEAVTLVNLELFAFKSTQNPLPLNQHAAAFECRF